MSMEYIELLRQNNSLQLSSSLLYVGDDLLVKDNVCVTKF